MAEDPGKYPAICATCQWCRPLGSVGGSCREPRNVDDTFMVSPGGTEMRLLVPMPINYRHITGCDFWKLPTSPNLRVVE